MQPRSGASGLKQSQVYPPRYGKQMARLHAEYNVQSSDKSAL